MSRIAIISTDLPVIVKNGGIGTACEHQAALLAEAGHDVTVVYVGMREDIEDTKLAAARKHFERLGARFETVLCRSNRVGTRLTQIFPAHPDMVMTVEADRWLRQHRFDLIIFMDWKGLGFAAIEARRAGVAHQQTTIAIITHSPALWHSLGQNESVGSWCPRFVTTTLERHAIAGADALISPSRYMIDWMQQMGWSLPEDRHVLPNPVAGTMDIAGKAHSHKSAPIEEIVFFGRLERRKGLELFLRALNRLMAEGHRPKITFLGKPDKVGERHALDLIVETVPDAGISFITDRSASEALAYLATPGRLAVIASLIDNSPFTVAECLLHGIPFIASAVGGIPELIDPADHEHCLFALRPDSLAEILGRCLTEGQARMRPALMPGQVAREWIENIERLALPHPRHIATDQVLPFITVCLVHYERPHFLEQAVRSLEAQTTTDFEVVLVDDGSRSASAVEALDALEERFQARGWRIIRGDNRYLGAARNRAARQARGAYLLFMDDDNVARPEEIATFAEAARRSGADLITCGFEVFTSADSPDETTCPVERYVPLGASLAFSLENNVIGDANALVKKSVFDELGGFTELYGVGFEDLELFSKIILAGYQIATIPDPLFYYRRQGGSMLASTSLDANRTRVLAAYAGRVSPEILDLVYMAEGSLTRETQGFRGINPFGLRDPFAPASWLQTPQCMPHEAESIHHAARIATLRGKHLAAKALLTQLERDVSISAEALDPLRLLISGPEMTERDLGALAHKLVSEAMPEETRKATLSVLRSALLAGREVQLPEVGDDPDICLLLALQAAQRQDFLAAENSLLLAALGGAEAYLADRADVAQAIAHGSKIKALHHFLQHGYREAMVWPDGAYILRVAVVLPEQLRQAWLSERSCQLLPLAYVFCDPCEIALALAQTPDASSLEALLGASLDRHVSFRDSDDRLGYEQYVAAHLGPAAQVMQRLPRQQPMDVPALLDRFMALSSRPAGTRAQPISEKQAEALYLEQNPDVRQAIQMGQFVSARAHYEAFGASEGRSWPG